MSTTIDYIRFLPEGSFALLKEERIGCELVMRNWEQRNVQGEVLLSYTPRENQLSWKVDIGKVAEIFNAYGIADKRLDVLIQTEGKSLLFRGIRMLDFTTEYHQKQPIGELLHTKLVLSYLSGKRIEGEI